MFVFSLSLYQSFNIIFRDNILCKSHVRTFSKVKCWRYDIYIWTLAIRIFSRAWVLKLYKTVDISHLTWIDVFKTNQIFNWSNETPYLKLSRVQKITTISNQSNFIVQSENYEYFQIGNIKWHQSSVYHLSGWVYGIGIFVHSWYFCAFTAYYCIYVSVMKCLLQNWLWWFVAKFCVWLNADKIHHKRFNK